MVLVNVSAVIVRKHSMLEHYRAVAEVYWQIHGGGNVEHTDRVIWFTAYERWLNDRPLMTDEDPGEPL